MSLLDHLKFQHSLPTSLIKKHYSSLLMDDETIEFSTSTKAIDIFFTSCRMVIAPKRNIGEKYLSFKVYPYALISHYEIFLKGAFELESKIVLYSIQSNTPLIEIPFKQDEDLFTFQQALIQMML